MATGFEELAPMAVNTVVENHSPFAARRFVMLDGDGQERTVLVIAATFLYGRASTAPEVESLEVFAGDVHFGDPASSSVRYEAELAWHKPRVEFLVNASAYAPGGRPVTTAEVSVRVGPILKCLHVSGDRDWRRAPLGSTPGSPRPFVCMPLTWERAFGGNDHMDGELSNPIGVGWRGARASQVPTECPNIEYPDSLVRSRSDRIRSAGFGIVGRGWRPRIDYAGTFDAGWQGQHWPLLPRDFSTRHFNCAPPDQQCDTLHGGEPVELIGLRPDGPWRFSLPRLTAPVHCFYSDGYECHAPRMDTVLIEPDLMRVRLTARLAITTNRARGPLRALVVGHMTRGWLQARIARKFYWNPSGRRGSLPPATNFCI